MKRSDIRPVWRRKQDENFGETVDQEVCRLWSEVNGCRVIPMQKSFAHVDAIVVPSIGDYYAYFLEICGRRRRSTEFSDCIFDKPQLKKIDSIREMTGLETTLVLAYEDAIMYRTNVNLKDTSWYKEDKTNDKRVLIALDALSRIDSHRARPYLERIYRSE